MEQDLKICVFVSGSKELQPLLEMTNPNKMEYCTRHGYSFHYHGQGEKKPIGGRPAERIASLLSVLRSQLYDYIFQLDADTIITNMETPVESLIDTGFGLVIATDAFQVQAGSYVIQNRPICIEFLNTVWEMRDPWPGPTTDQSAFDILLKTPRFSSMVKFVPQRALNSYQYKWYPLGGPKYVQGLDQFDNSGEWQPGDFVFHCPGLLLETKVVIMKEMLPKVQR